jgi:hypothetical protein
MVEQHNNGLPREANPPVLLGLRMCEGRDPVKHLLAFRLIEKDSRRATCGWIESPIYIRDSPSFLSLIYIYKERSK